jgi:hypothetical protein
MAGWSVRGAWVGTGLEVVSGGGSPLLPATCHSAAHSTCHSTALTSPPSQQTSITSSGAGPRISRWELWVAPCAPCTSGTEPWQPQTCWER